MSGDESVENEGKSDDGIANVRRNSIALTVRSKWMATRASPGEPISART